MERSSTRSRASSRNRVAAGSVWETRMRMDEVQGGIRVFDGSNEGKEDSNSDEEGIRVYEKLRKNQPDSIGEGRRKRRSWGVPEPADNFFINRTPSPLQFRYDVFDEQEVEIGVEEEGRNFDDKEMDQPAVNLENGMEKTIELLKIPVTVSSFQEEKKPDFDLDSHKKPVFDSSEVEMKQHAAFQASDISEKKLNSKHNDVVVSPSEVERKHDPFFEVMPKIDRRRNSVFQAWAKLEKKQNTVGSSSRKPEKRHSHAPRTPPANTDKKHCYVFSASSKDSPVIEMEKKTDLDHRKPSSSTPSEQVFPRASYGHTMQSIVDLVMWKDVQRSAFVFVFGAFLLIILSYAEDFSFNSVSLASYLGLIYLASVFFYKSIISRGERKAYKEREERYNVEEEAIWVLKLVLPYINELLLSMSALFSGDPATTMKVAVLLLVIAKCGAYITVWNLAKMAFLGVFTIPKLYSSYSDQLAMQGECWMEMLKEGWEVSNHKRAIIVATFIVVWSISSTAARIWSVFMLIVAMKLYQQRSEEEEINKNSRLQQQHSLGTDRTEVVRERKLKKES